MASVAVQDYRDRGYSPEGVLNYLARFGWSHGDQEIFTREQLIEAFSWDRCGRADGKFDEAKFADVAFEHLKEPSLMSSEAYRTSVLPFLKARGIDAADPERLAAAIELVRPRARNFVDAADALDYFLRSEPEFDPKARAKFLTPSHAEVLGQLRDLLSSQREWEVASLESAVKGWAERHDIKMKDVAQPARVALTGRTASPGLFEVMVVLGRAQSLSRLSRGRELAMAPSGA